MKVFYLILLFAGAVANAYAQEQIQASRIYKANIFETIKREASFSVLRRKLQEAGADGIFLSFDRFTLFAPINDAFDASPYDVDMLRSKRGMQFILEKHIISRSVDLDRIDNELRVNSIGGNELTIRNIGGRFTVNNIRVVRKIETSDGIIYAIERLLN